MLAAASRSDRISACAVGSPSRSRWFPAAPTTVPSRTTTAPMGTSPQDRHARAWSRARSMKVRGSATMAGAIVTPAAGPSEEGDLLLGLVRPHDPAGKDEGEQEQRHHPADQREPDPRPQVHRVGQAADAAHRDHGEEEHHGGRLPQLAVRAPEQPPRLRRPPRDPASPGQVAADGLAGVSPVLLLKILRDIVRRPGISEELGLHEASPPAREGLLGARMPGEPGWASATSPPANDLPARIGEGAPRALSRAIRKVRPHHEGGTNADVSTSRFQR